MSELSSTTGAQMLARGKNYIFENPWLQLICSYLALPDHDYVILNQSGHPFLRLANRHHKILVSQHLFVSKKTCGNLAVTHKTDFRIDSGCIHTIRYLVEKQWHNQQAASGVVAWSKNFSLLINLSFGINYTLQLQSTSFCLPLGGGLILFLCLHHWEGQSHSVR